MHFNELNLAARIATAARSLTGPGQRLWRRTAALLATVFIADLVVVMVLNRLVTTVTHWQGALLDAALLTAVLAAPLGWWLRSASRAPQPETGTAGRIGARMPLRLSRVRAALYGIVLVMVSAGGWQVWQANQAEAARRVDAEMLSLVGHQRMQSQRIGRLAALATLAPRSAATHLLELRQAQAAMMQASQRMQALVAQQLAQGDAQSDTLQSLFNRVNVQQQSLWDNAAFVAQVDVDLMPPIALGLQAEAEAVLRDMDALAGALQERADARSEQAIQSTRSSAWFRLGLLGCLVLMVLEPVLRALQRQQRSLVLQAERTQYLALAAQRTGNGVIFTDTDHRIVWVNEGFTRLAGYTLGEVLGQDPAAVLTSERTPAAAQQRLQQAIASRQALQTQVCQRSKTGDEIWVDIDLQPLHDDNGVHTGFVEIVSDINAQVLQRQHLAKLITTMPVGMLVHNAAGRITECNEAACRLLNLSAEQLQGRELSDPLWSWEQEDGSPLPDAAQPLLTTLREGRGVRGAVARIPLPDGGQRWVAVDSQPLLDREGQIEGVITCLVDLTEKRSQEARLRLIVEGAGLGTWEADLAGGHWHVNEHWARMLGYEPGQLDTSGNAWRQLVHPQDLPQALRGLQAHLKDPAVAFRTELRMRHAQGHWAWVFTAGTAIERGADGRAKRVAGVHLDIDRARRAEAQAEQARCSAERALAELRAYQAALDEHAIVAVTDASGTIKHANERFCQISKYSRDELVGHTHRVVNSGTHSRAFWADMWRHVAQGRSWQGEVCNRARDGSLYWVDTTIVPVLDLQGRVVEHVAIRTEITQRKQLEDQLRNAALTDGLTQLPNRVSILEKLKDAVLRARRLAGYHFAVLFMDFDRFKLVNDSLGHDVGDELLRQIAQRLRTALREGDALSRTDDCSHTAARIGGDEFVILLDGIRGVEDAELVARRLLRVLSQPYAIGVHKVHSSASIGVVASDTNRGDADELLRDADTAMYEAKRSGRGRYVLFDATMHERVSRTLSIENDIRRGLQHDEFFVVYQPIVDIASGGLRGVEALARWRHPERGLVSPLEFIPIAEDTGLITALGSRVLRDACAQFMQWQGHAGAAAPGYVAVNLSRAQLCQGDIVATVQAELQRCGMPPNGLRLEVTETLAMQDRSALAVLQQLKDLGVRLALDDFGTGYSSLACLHEIPVDMVKIDRSFVSNLSQSNHRRVLIQATVLVAQALHIETVAEGVETADQARLLGELGCTLAQGFHFGRPMTAPDLAKWMERSATPLLV